MRAGRKNFQLDEPARYEQKQSIFLPSPALLKPTQSLNLLSYKNSSFSLSLFCTPFSDLTRAKVATASIHGMDFFSIPVSQWNRARGRTGHVTTLHTLTDTAYSCRYCLFFLKISDSNLSWKFNLSLVAVFALKIVMFMVWNSYGEDIRKWIKSGLVLEFRPAPFRGVGKIVKRGGGSGGGIALCTRFLSTWTKICITKICILLD